MPSALIPYVVFFQTAGALIGVGTTTFAEVFYTKAAADGIIDHHERKYLRHLFHGLRIGVVLVLLSGIALIVLEYLVPNAPQDVLTAPFWALEVLTLLVVLFGWMLSKKHGEWWFSSAAILTAWWMILLIDLGFMNAYGFLILGAMYVLATFIVAGLLGYLRILLRPRKKDISSHLQN